jgi:chorismate-pyruvate lyase
MTPTLEAFHDERIHLRLLDRRLEGETLSREVVLTTDQTLRPVEFGAIAIHLQHFPEAARETILGCHTPLGTILADFEIEHSSHPRGFFQIEADGLICESLGLDGPCTLYGRRNVLSTPAGHALAEVVEILPPLG